MHRTIISIKFYVALSLCLNYVQCQYFKQPTCLNMTPTSTDGSGRHFIAYGNPMEVTCTGEDAARLKMRLNFEEISTEQVNETTIRWFRKKPELQNWYLECNDTKSGCVNSIFIIVEPAVQVISPHIRRDELIIVQYGDPLEVHCSGPDANGLSITHDLVGPALPSVIINETAIKYVIEKPKLQDSSYFCHFEDYTYTFQLIVESPPEAVRFRCISHQQELLNCTWMALSERTNYTLFYIMYENYDPVPIRLCAKQPSSIISTLYCIWSTNDDPSFRNYLVTLPFIMQSCNDLGCSNRTIEIDHRSIIKYSPPVISKVVKNTKARNVSIYWSIPAGDREVVHKVKYWFSGVPDRRSVNSSYVLCDRTYRCNITIDLPCPRKSYKVWIYVKPRASDGDDYWSEPASIHFSTDVMDDKLEDIDPECELESKITKEVIVYLINELRKEVRQSMLARKAELRSLRNKRATIREMDTV